jgi:predicted double-glycine peptidase
MKNIIVVFILSGLFIIFFPDSSISQTRFDPLCGPKSLFAVCEHYGIQASLSELCELSKYDNKNGTTMLNLYNAATSMGLNAKPLRLSLGDLCKIEGLSIVYVNGNHFTLVHQCLTDDVALQDERDKRYLQSKDEFNKRWNGAALVFTEVDNIKQILTKQAKLNANPNIGPAITFESDVYDFGAIDAGEVYSCFYKFQNTGSDTLKILEVRGSCGCTNMQLSKKIVPPGGIGDIYVEYNTAGKTVGEHTETIFVKSNDPYNSFVKLTMKAVIANNSIAVIPSNIYLGEIEINKEVEREIIISADTKNKLQIEKIEVSEGISYTVKQGDVINNKNVVKLTLGINSGGKTGSYKKNIFVYTNDSRNSVIEIPVTGEVISSVKVFPPRVFFGSVEPNTTHDLQVKIIFQSGEVPKLSDITSDMKNIQTKLSSLENESGYLLNVKLKTAEKEITIKDNIKIFYNNGRDREVIEIPLYAKVSGK